MNKDERQKRRKKKNNTAPSVKLQELPNESFLLAVFNQWLRNSSFFFLLSLFIYFLLPFSIIICDIPTSKESSNTLFKDTVVESTQSAVKPVMFGTRLKTSLHSPQSTLDETQSNSNNV